MIFISSARCILCSRYRIESVYRVNGNRWWNTSIKISAQTARKVVRIDTYKTYRRYIINIRSACIIIMYSWQRVRRAYRPSDAVLYIIVIPNNIIHVHTNTHARAHEMFRKKLSGCGLWQYAGGMINYLKWCTRTQMFRRNISRGIILLCVIFFTRYLRLVLLRR